MKIIVSLIPTIVWICGIVLAKGFWSTLFAIIIPFWSYYLVMEKILQTFWLT